MPDKTTIVTMDTGAGITPARARDILAANGLQVTKSQAEQITTFLYNLAEKIKPATKQKQ